jgi:hypothetical protein
VYRGLERHKKYVQILKSGVPENEPGNTIKILKGILRGKHFVRVEID